MLFTISYCMDNFLKIYHRSFVLFSVLWLIFPKFSSLLIIWLCLLTIYGAIKKQLVFKPNIILFAMMALFGAYLLSIFVHGAPLSSLKFLENKLSLLIIPLIISFYPAKHEELINLLRAHIIGCIVLISIAFYHSYQCNMAFGESLRCFSTTNFSQIHHPSYFSAFLIFSSVLVILDKSNTIVPNKPLRIILFLATLLVQWNLGALAGFLTIILLVLILPFLISVFEGGLKKLILSYSILTIIGIGFVFSSKEIKADFSNALGFLKNYYENPEEFIRNRTYPLEGNETRMILWDVSTKICLKHPLGVGLGNLDFFMQEELEPLGHGQLATKQNNPHNQFIQVTAELGLIGLALFVFIIIYLLVIALKQRRLILFSLVLAFVVFCLFESMIQRQSGIIFFCFWFAALSKLDEKNRFVL